jgi:CRP-like cAMP-binding protein
MAKKATTRATPNLILAQLSTADFALLEPHLKAADLPVRLQLEDYGRLIRHAYFVERGIVSVVANGQGKRSIEVGIIGREGMTGFALIMGEERATHESFVQLAGSGQRITAAHLRMAIKASVTLHAAFLRYGNTFVAQTAQTALANGRSKIEQRLARWLLMAHDRIDGDDMLLTHEFLAVMLGVRRPGVTQALNALQQAGLIRSSRGTISILDRAGLEKNSDGTYRP